jgi:hypothetical protein
MQCQSYLRQSPLFWITITVCTFLCRKSATDITNQNSPIVLEVLPVFSPQMPFHRCTGYSIALNVVPNIFIFYLIF